MDLIDIVTLLDSNLIREGVMYKDNVLMQKTVQYVNTFNLIFNINNQSFNNINQAVFVSKNNAVYLYLISNLFNKNENIIEFEINSINSFTLGAG